MKLIDANSLIILLVGLIEPKLIGRHRRTSIYTEDDFITLTDVIGDFNNLVVLPNVWTEVDNLLNDFSGEYKYPYIKKFTELVKVTSERHLSSIDGCNSMTFFDLGLTDSLLVELSKQCDMLITCDSSLSDYASANGVNVFDLVRYRNSNL
jgi:hypothetical protein